MKFKNRRFWKIVGDPIVVNFFVKTPLFFLTK